MNIKPQVDKLTQESDDFVKIFKLNYDIFCDEITKKINQLDIDEKELLKEQYFNRLKINIKVLLEDKKED